MKKTSAAIEALLTEKRTEVLTGWLAELSQGGGEALGSERHQTAALLDALLDGLRAAGDADDLDLPAWQPLHDHLEALSRSRAAQGAAAADTSRALWPLCRTVRNGGAGATFAGV